jgi:geranylgeranyl reductase family protein
MPYPEKFDVVIVGAGPAGAQTGYHLARRGLRILIIEKKKIPRYKACGGGLTRRTLDILPFDIGSVVENYPAAVKILVANRPVFHKVLHDPVLAMVMRDKFDHFLVQKAVAAGAVLQEKTTVRSLSGVHGQLNVESSRGRFKTRFVVGADGVDSLVARALGLPVFHKQMIALEGEVYLNNYDLAEDLKSTAQFDFGVIPHGYGWVFPKNDHLSVGLVTRSRKIKGFKDYFLAYLRLKNSAAQAEIRVLKGHRIAYPAAGRFWRLSNRRGLVVGDAAGLADPITGEGIFYALGSAKIAADVLSDAIVYGDDRIRSYTGKIYGTFGRDLRWARTIAYLLYQLPAVSLKLLRSHGRRLGEYHLDIMTGKRRYAEAASNAIQLIRRRLSDRF